MVIIVAGSRPTATASRSERKTLPSCQPEAFSDTLRQIILISYG